MTPVDALRALRNHYGAKELARRLKVPVPSLRRMISTGKLSPGVRTALGGPRTLPKRPSKKRATREHIKEMISAMAAYKGQPKQRHLYERFRSAKRALYRLYPGEPRKAKALVRFALAKAGWLPEREHA